MVLTKLKKGPFPSAVRFFEAIHRILVWPSINSNWVQPDRPIVMQIDRHTRSDIVLCDWAL